jgi:DNA repair protein RadD
MSDLFRTNVVNQSHGHELASHQVRALDQMRDQFRKRNRRVVLQMATGAGKTFWAATVSRMVWAKNPDARIMFTVPMLSILEKTIVDFKNAGIHDIGVIQATHPMRNAHAKLQIASVQTLARREIPDCNMVFVDECHARSQAIVDMMEDQKRCNFIGLSATPWRKGMGDEWDALCVAATTADLIESGWRKDFRVFAPDVPDLSGCATKANEFGETDYTDAAAENAMRPIVGNVVQTWLRLGQNQPTLGFAVNRVSAKDMQERFERSGIASGYIDGFTDPIEQEYILREFHSGRIKVIWSVQKLIAGVDLDVGCIIDCAPTRSEIRHVQKIGRARGIKPHLGDSQGRPIIIDHAGNSLELGLVTEIIHNNFVSGKRSEIAERERKEKLPKACTRCDYMIPVAIKVCPSCGAEKALPPPRETVDGELAELTRDGKVKDTMADKQRFYSMALMFAASKHWPDRRVAGMYRGRFGVWPKGLSDDWLEPDQAFLNYEKSQRIRYAKSMEKKNGGEARA